MRGPLPQIGNTRTYVVTDINSEIPTPIPLTDIADPNLDAKVTIIMKHAPLALFLESISAQTRINFIIREGVGKRFVKAVLTDATAREALQILLLTKDLNLERETESADD